MRNYCDDLDHPEEIITCSNGGYAIVGTAGEDQFPDGGDLLLVRIDDDGDQVWSYTYPHPGRQYGRSVVECPDGGFLICSGLQISDSNFDVWLVKIDANGSYVWDNNYGGTSYEYGRKILRCNEGGYAVSGASDNSSILLMRFDEDLNLLWKRDYGSVNHETFRDFVECDDGGFAVAGRIGNLEFDQSGLWIKGTQDILIIQTDSDGNQQWNKTYGGLDSEDMHTIIRCADGGYAIAGLTSPTPQYQLLYYYHYENWIMRLNSLGEIIWQKKYPTGENLVTFSSMIPYNDVGYALAGHAYHRHSPPNYIDIVLQSTDSAGIRLWNHTHYVGVYGSTRDIVQSSGGFIVTGYNKTSGPSTESRMFVLWFPDDTPAGIIPEGMESFVIVTIGLGIVVTIVVTLYKKRS